MQNWVGHEVNSKEAGTYCNHKVYLKFPPLEILLHWFHFLDTDEDSNAEARVFNQTVYTEEQES